MPEEGCSSTADTESDFEVAVGGAASSDCGGGVCVGRTLIRHVGISPCYAKEDPEERKKDELVSVYGTGDRVDWKKHRRVECELDSLLKATSRKRRNRLCGLFDGVDGGVWKTKDEDMEVIIQNYFTNLFTSSRPSAAVVNDVLNSVQGSLQPDLKAYLDSVFTAEEVCFALFQINPLKAPGEDGFPTAFFQKFWAVVGQDVTQMCLNCLNGGMSVEKINRTVICLIPKVRKVEYMADIRPISLCNVVYKCVSKVLANWLRKALGSVIYENQSAFVPGRSITDNAMVRYECMHALRSKVNGKKKGFMSIKLDMSKAYDKVEWCFVEGMMRRLGFFDKWIGLIMDCVSTVSYSFCLNGKVCGHIVPFRGLRQGDPLSPYLFLLCAEGLSSLINESERWGIFSGFRCSRWGPKITHLFFADDSLLFTRASKEECINVRRLLDSYSQASGQCINFNKSAVCFSKQISQAGRGVLANVLGMSIVGCHSKYLGLSCVIGRNKIASFDVIKDRVWKKLQSWSSRFFSGGGKEVLIKAVIQAIPVYSMSLFKLHVSLIYELHHLCARFWWGGGSSTRKLHWCSWDAMCKPKEEGGLGFKDLGSFNQALLAKQFWRLIQFPDSLVARVLKACYYPEVPLLKAGKGSSSSFLWKSLVWGGQLVERGYRWRVGTGRSIYIYKNRWISRESTFKIISPPMLGEWATVDELKCGDGSWNSDVVRQAFVHVDADAILGIPTGRMELDDSILWHYEVLGSFSVKSSYRLARYSAMASSSFGLSQSVSWWKWFWKISLPPKLKIFVWKACNNWFPTRVNLVSHGMKLKSLCPICNQKEESSLHALWRCSALKGVRSFSGLTVPSHVVDSLFFLEFCWLCKETKEAVNFLANFKEARGVEQCERAGQAKNIRLKTPTAGCVKINSDATLSDAKGVSGVGVVIRDWKGEVLASCCQRFEVCFQPFIAEAVAILTGIRLALQLGLFPALLESDALAVVELISAKVVPASDVGIVINDILNLISSCFVSFSFVPRLANRVAHGLAKLALDYKGRSVWVGDCPLAVESLVLGDC
ncbi:hypothetical protein LWI29_029944 [Acer saccharum]|uniref:Reverse transcriptase domain-containing protein n=1 Tax=Acer saccharum TaxID=4024 RepID=A0AA39TXU9_ACESA|nr:hypothetical protein LWI29_029944 [Acer saccharum]